MTPDPPARLVALLVDARDPRLLAAYWAALLGREIGPEGTTVLAPRPEELEMRFVSSDLERHGLGRMHPDLTSDSLEDQAARVALALRLGARHLDVGQRGDEGHVVLADPEGNEHDVIEAGNAFLAGTGRIGAMAGDGRRVTGLFWSAALGWPLVWDQDEETAIQSPSGGVKLTWGGPPVAPKREERNRLRLLLDGDRDRLISLGAKETHDHHVLLDPDDNELELVP